MSAGTAASGTTATRILDVAEALAQIRGFNGFSYADIAMRNGESLEGIGVTPDELVLPSARDLAAGRDPVLSHAIARAGATVDPQAAAHLFPTVR